MPEGLYDISYFGECCESAGSGRRKYEERKVRKYQIHQICIVGNDIGRDLIDSHRLSLVEYAWISKRFYLNMVLKKNKFILRNLNTVWNYKWKNINYNRKRR